jgi:hypothetical protein
MMSRVTEGSGQFPVFDQSPLYLRLTLLFPYTEGMMFQNDVLTRDGDEGFAEVFRRPPGTTQQIIHPEKYFDHTDPTSPELPDAHLPPGYKPLVGGTLGELDHAVLLEQFAGKARAEEIAPHWRGSNFELRERKKDASLVLLYAVEWDSQDIARAYFLSYRRALEKKWKNMRIASEDPDLLTGTGDDGRFELRRQGAIVTSMEGLPPGNAADKPREKSAHAAAASADSTRQTVGATVAGEPGSRNR